MTGSSPSSTSPELLLHELLRVHEGLTAVPRGSHGLSVLVVVGVSGHEDSGDARLRPVPRDDVTPRVELDLPGEDLGIRLVADRDEEAIDLDQALLSRLDIPYLHPLDPARAEDLINDRVPDEADLRVRESLLLQRLARAELIPPVYDLDAGGELRQKGRLLHRRVPSTDDRDPLSPEEETVADGTVGDTLPHQPHLGVELQPLRVGPRGDQDRECLDGLAWGGHLEWVTLEVDLHDVVLHQLCADPLRLRLHTLHQLRSKNRFHKSRKVLDVARYHELSTVLRPHEEERLHVGSRTIDGGGEPGGAGTDND